MVTSFLATERRPLASRFPWVPLPASLDSVVEGICVYYLISNSVCQVFFVNLLYFLVILDLFP